MKKMGWKPFYKTVDIPESGRWHRLLVGEYAGKNEALHAVERLKSQGLITKILIHKYDNAVNAISNNSGASASRNSTVDTEHSILIDKTQERKITAGKSEKKHTHVGIKIDQERPVKPHADRGISTRKKIISDIKEKAFVKKQATRKVDVPSEVSPVFLKENPKEQVSLYDEAMLDFQSGRHEDAVKKLTDIVEGNPVNAKQKERVLRCLADCYYMLGEKDGNNKNYLEMTV
jgi:hypothetical protein